MAASPPARSDAHALDAITFWELRGVPVLPESSGTKGPWPNSWPSLAPDEAWARSRQRAVSGSLNLALRLGPTSDGLRILGHLDFDGSDGVDPDAALERARALFPGAPLLQTSDGRWRMYFWSTREIAEGVVRELGAEIAATANRLSIVHGTHPSGSRYEWIEPPEDHLPTVDVDALGLVVEPRAAATGSGVRRGPGGRQPTRIAFPDRLREFESSMVRVGVQRGHDEEFHSCP